MGAITICVDLCLSVTDFSPVDFCLFHLTLYKVVFSALLTKEDNEEKAHSKAMFGSFFRAFKESTVRP